MMTKEQKQLKNDFENQGVLQSTSGEERTLGGKPIHRQFKDSAFCILYGVPSTARLLIRDLTGVEYREDEIEIVTLKCLIGDKSKHNDLGVLAGDELFIFGEEQSYECGNLPTRFLLYFAQTLQEYLVHHKLILFTLNLSNFPYASSASINVARYASFGFLASEKFSCI